MSSRGCDYLLCVSLLLLARQSSMSEGTLLPAESVDSRYLGAARTVWVYLPPSYQHSPKRHYPVLYLHDGQNVFSSAGTNCCFGWGSWELDKTAEALANAGRMQEIIMVAVENSRSRYQEYRGPSSASKTRRTVKRPDGGPPEEDRFEKYASFLIKELKPRIDARYRTLPAAAHTAVMGSSLGGKERSTLTFGGRAPGSVSVTRLSG